MKIWGLASIEKAARAARDRFIVRPLARSRMIQRHAHFGYDYSLKLNGDHKIAYNPRDRGAIGAHLVRHGEWFREDFRSVLSALARHGRSTTGKVFVDVGANIGTQTIYALVADDFAQAVAIEPVPENLTLLQINMTLNGLTDRVAIVGCAAGAKSERRSLMVSRHNAGGHSLLSSIIPVTEHERSIDVDVEPVDAILQRNSIKPHDVGLVLIDVEGFEPEAIAGLPRLLEARVPLFVELNTHFYGMEATRALLSLLGKHYSLVYSPGVRGLAPREFEIAEIDERYLPGDLLFL